MILDIVDHCPIPSLSDNSWIDRKNKGKRMIFKDDFFLLIFLLSKFLLVYFFLIVNSSFLRFTLLWFFCAADSLRSLATENIKNLYFLANKNLMHFFLFFFHSQKFDKFQAKSQWSLRWNAGKVQINLVADSHCWKKRLLTNHQNHLNNFFADFLCI